LGTIRSSFQVPGSSIGLDSKVSVDGDTMEGDLSMGGNRLSEIGEIDMALGDIVNGGQISADIISASRFIDSDNPALGLDPSSADISRSTVTALRINNDLQTDEVTSIGNNLVLNPSASGRVLVGESGILEARDIFVTNKNGSTPLSQLLPNYSMVGAVLVGHGSRVPVPSCGTGGAPRIILGGGLVTSRLYAVGGVNQVGHLRFARRSGNVWIVYSRNPRTNETARGQLLARVYCDY